MWLHEQCVIDDTLKRTYERLIGDADAVDNENENETLKPPSKKGRRKSAKPKAPTNIWDGIFSATIEARDSEPSETNPENDHENENDNNTAPDSNAESETDIKSAGKLVIADLRATSDDDDAEPRIWEEDIVCLGCRRKIK